MKDSKPDESKKFPKKKSHSKNGDKKDFFNAIHQFIKGFAYERGKVYKKLGASTLLEDTLLNKFVIKVKSAFTLTKPEKRDEKEEKRLAGRIRELNKNANDVLKVLNMVREDLKKEIDGELYTYVESVMTPMIRDVEKVQKIIKNEKALHTQIHAIKKYNQWINKAKSWVQLCSTARDKEAIGKAIVKHTVDDFMAMIDRDLQLVDDYLDHLLSEVILAENEKNLLKKELQEALRLYTKSMMNLKNYPKNLSLEELNVWKDGADKMRNIHFNAALQIIDNKIDKLNPIKNKHDEHEMLISHLEKISYLEEEIPMLVEKFEQKIDDPVEFELILHRLLELEFEVNDLYLDIGMPPMMVERLLPLKELLSKKIHP